MSLEDFSAKFKARKGAETAANVDDTSYDFKESYRIRAKMLGVLLRDARVSAARTPEDCARLLRIEGAQIEAWELGHAVPSLPQLELLAYYLDVPLSHFWGMETSKISRAGRENIQPEYVTLRNRMVGALLRQAREERGLSQAELAEQAGLDESSVAAFELGQTAPPMHILSVLAGCVNKSLSYFLESDSQIGELLAMRESWKHFADLPEDVRAFAADPTNIGFIHIAVMLSKMPTDQLREVGASILDITM